ncbi:MAG: hypothetical protein RL701_2033 [Pseudomonadota bacterium]
MRDARPRSHTLTRRSVMPDWLPLDVLVQWANLSLGLTVLLVGQRLQHPGAWFGLHVTLALAVYMLAKHADAEAAGSDPLTLLHHWLPALVVPAIYFELGLLIPLVRDYSDYRYDYALQAIDVWVLGDDPAAAVGGFANRALSDILSACYVGYYAFTLAVPVALYMRGAYDEYQRVASIIVVAFLVSYVGYVIVPALGPHRLFDGPRPLELEGYGFARYSYQQLLGIPNEPPDAFPSGHSLIGVIVPALAWRWHRPLFYWLAPVGVGIVLATIYLRLHYLTDVVAAFALAPVCWQLGRAVERRFGAQPAERPSFEGAAPESPDLT